MILISLITDLLTSLFWNMRRAIFSGSTTRVHNGVVNAIFRDGRTEKEISAWWETYVINAPLCPLCKQVLQPKTMVSYLKPPSIVFDDCPSTLPLIHTFCALDQPLAGTINSSGAFIPLEATAPFDFEPTECVILKIDRPEETTRLIGFKSRDGIRYG